jgi:uncharacterized membrane protein required for colicin V production
MNPVDVFCLAFIAYHALTGLVRGFVQQILRITFWAGGLYLTRQFSGRFAERLLEVHPDLGASGAHWTAWFAILLGTLAAGFLLLQLAKAALGKLKLTGADRLAGLVFGAAKAALIIVIAMVGVLAVAKRFDAQDRLATSRAAQWSALVLERTELALPEETVDEYVEWVKSRAAGLVVPPQGIPPVNSK